MHRVAIANRFCIILFYGALNAVFSFVSSPITLQFSFLELMSRRGLELKILARQICLVRNIKVRTECRWLLIVKHCVELCFIIYKRVNNKTLRKTFLCKYLRQCDGRRAVCGWRRYVSSRLFVDRFGRVTAWWTSWVGLAIWHRVNK